MAVRKIPIKQHPYLGTPFLDLSSTEHTNERPEDPAVAIFLTEMRKKELMDRALHDKVCLG
jgi:replicative DNA helicase